MTPDHHCRVRQLAVLAFWLGGCTALLPRCECAAACPQDSVGLGQIEADLVLGTGDCRGFGQVFLAPDTLIRSITVWRPPTPALDPFKRRLFITEVDTTGRPLEQTRLLDGPELIVQEGD